MKNINESKERNIINGFAVVSIFVVLLVNIMSFLSIQSIHNTTEDIYNHPLKVSNAALMVQTGVIKIHRDMKDVVLATDDSELAVFVKKVDKEEKNVYKYLDIIQVNILGEEGLRLEKETYKLFKDWKKIRDTVISLVDKKEFEEAVFITKNRGAVHVRALEASADKLYHYAHVKADSFKKKAHTTFTYFYVIDIVLTAITIIMFLIFMFYIRYRIKNYFSLIRENEKVLQEFNTQYKLAIEGTNDGLWDWNIKEGTVYFSPRWKEMLGFRDDELANSFESWESRVHPDDLEEANTEIEKAHANPEYEYRTVHRLQHKNGSWVWILDRGKTLFDAEGKPVRMVGFHTDITKEKELEEALRESNETFELFMNHTQTDVFIAEDGVVIYANTNANHFFQHKSLIGLKTEELLPKKEVEILENAMNEALKNGQFDNIFTTKNALGEEKVFHQLFFAMDKKRKRVGLISIDITKEKLQEEELHNQEEIMIAQSRHAAMGEMISMIAHQWRQPISVIAMDANNIQADIELDMLDSEELLNTSKDIIHQTQELSKTIDDFRGFFKPNKEVEEVFIKSIFDDAFSILGASLTNNNITFDIELDASMKITTFSRELMQVIINIVKNAKEALLGKEITNKHIEIEVLGKSAFIIITICDNAGGIDTEILDKIFNPYFTTKEEQNGTGLGLYMSKTIVEKHLYGTIKASNVKNGACFEIRLPKYIESTL